MKLNIILLCVILLNIFCDFISYLMGNPCHYRALFGADLVNILLAIGQIILLGKIIRLKEKKNEK